MEQEQPGFDALWQEVNTGIARLGSLLHGDGENFSTGEYVDLYTAIFNMCRPPYSCSKQLYELYKKMLEEYTQFSVLPVLRKKHGEFLLKEFLVIWKKQQVMVRWLSRFFDPLDHSYVEPNLLLPLRELGISCFHDMVFNELKTTLTTIVIGMIDDERDGMLIDRALVKDILDIYVDMGRQSLGIYKFDFEQKFYNCTSEYYSKGQTWIEEDSCPQYMFKAEECLQKERERVLHYLQPSTEQNLLDITVLELISRLVEQMLKKENSGFKLLLIDNKINELSRMYRLSSRVEDGLSQVSELFMEHVIEEGMYLVKHVDSKKEFVRKDIELYDKQLTFVSECFKNHKAFHKALKQAFELVWNTDIAGCSSAELLASFCDGILRKGAADKLSYEAVEETLDKVVKMLSFMGDKDLFLQFLRKKLGKRLILLERVNYEYERSLLSKLKQALNLGGRSISQMVTMLSEMQTAIGHQNLFEEYIISNPELNGVVGFSPTVLTTGLWPSYPTLDINLPSEMEKCLEVFKEYYKSKHPKERLTWNHSFGTCNIVAKFDRKEIELVVTTYQAAVLLLFNDVDQLSYAEIVRQLDIPHEDAICLLHSLSCGKYKFLHKVPHNMNISRSDIFHFNHGFTDKMQYIKVPVPLRADENKKVIADVKRDRRIAIQASIVRIMKSRKVLSHKLLVAECTKQLSRDFKAETSAIKTQIESLIDREYLERDKETSNSYRYLA